MAENIHVVPAGDQWAVEREGDASAMSTFSTQQEAIDFARDQARNDEVELVVHGADGSIREKDSHGNDPRDIPG
jgi:hypothetical protein